MWYYRIELLIFLGQQLHQIKKLIILSIIVTILQVQKLEKQLREEKLKKDQAINKLAEMMMRKDLQVPS